MLKIAISGAPTVGKTTITETLWRLLDDSRTISTNFQWELFREDLTLPQSPNKLIKEEYQEIETVRLIGSGMVFKHRREKIIIFDSPWIDIAICYLVARAIKERKTKLPKRAELEDEIIPLREKAIKELAIDPRAEGMKCSTDYDIIVFNRLPKRQYKLPTRDSRVPIEFRNLANDFFCSLYTPYLKQRSKLLPHTRIVTNANPFGCKCSVNSFMRNLVGNEILPAIC